jgi:tRNA pseudouridine55 synthase
MSKLNKNLIGAFNINKPPDITSHDVVLQTRRLLNQIENKQGKQANKVGHAGTLDPFATGVLLILVGPANRLMEYIHLLPKTYQAEITLGATSDTDDLTGKITNSKVKNPEKITKSKIQETIKKFVGTSQQRPPIFSAKKVDGKKLYEYARAGLSSKALSKAGDRIQTITIHSINILQYKYPVLELEITCSSGTYIRSLARDIGTTLNTGAYVSKLTRIIIGSVKQSSSQQFNIENSIQINQLTNKNALSHLLPPEKLVSHLPSVTLSKNNVAQLINGQSIEWSTKLSANQPLALFTKKHSIIGIGTYNSKTSLLSPVKILSPPS